MRRLYVLALLTPLVAACGGHSKSSAPGGPASHWVTVEHLPQSAAPGAELFASKGCLTCHTYAGSGHTVLNAPDLTAIGAKKLGVRFQIAHLKCPSCVIKDSPMPPSSSLTPMQLHQLAMFLEASKGTH
jgi:mono/diheme cytochrome c family protein